MSVNSPPPVNSSGAPLLCAPALMNASGVVLQQNIKNHPTGNNSPVDGCFSREGPPHSWDSSGGRKSDELLRKKSGSPCVTVDANQGNTGTHQGMHSKTENPKNSGVGGTLRANATAFVPPTYPPMVQAPVQEKAPVQEEQVRTSDEEKHLIDEYHKFEILGDRQYRNGFYENARQNFAKALRLRIDVAVSYHQGKMDERHYVWSRRLHKKCLNAERALGINRELSRSLFMSESESSVWSLPSIGLIK